MKATNRGRLLPIPLRLEIRERVAAGESRRKVAEQLGIDKDTACKYAPKFAKVVSDTFIALKS